MIKLSTGREKTTIKITFSLPATDPAGPVSVVGDFNDWTPGHHTLCRRSNGTRSVAVEVPADATVRFRYLGEGGNWFDDVDADSITEHGGTLSTSAAERRQR